MATSAHITLGTPGIYFRPDVPLRALTGVRMDVCAFLGLAPRGPAREPVVNDEWHEDRPCVEPQRPRRRTIPVAVESFNEYKRLYGGFEGPGLLPYAVAAFFEQGGQRAYIARIVHEYGDQEHNAAGVACGDVLGAKTAAGPLRLYARNEGRWGNHLRASLSFSAQPLSFDTATSTMLTLAADVTLPAGTLLRLTLPGGLQILRFVSFVSEYGYPQTPETFLQATFDQSTSAAAESVEVIEGMLLVEDGDGQRERHERLGLSPLHPRWLAMVLCYESELVYPAASWIDVEIVPDSPDLIPIAPALPQFCICLKHCCEESYKKPQFQGGKDRYADITPEDFFDPSWTFGDDDPGDGVQSLTHLADLSLLVLPDLYSPAPLEPIEAIGEPVSLAGPTFERCVDFPPIPPAQAVVTPDLEGLRLDPRQPEDLRRIAALQAGVVAFAELMQSFVVLLDVPPGLNQRQILAWRAPFTSSYAAAYHPWLQVSRRDDSRDKLIRVPPSAIAAGIIARQEVAFGVPHGPANVIAAEVLEVDDHVSPARHEALHPPGINVYLQERDGIRLTAARTLSRLRTYRQLSVRRLVTMIRRTLEQQTQWIVFEPNNSALRSEVRHLLTGYLRQLYLAGAFTGATEAEAYFVRCDGTLNTPRLVDAGQLIAEIGIAPAEPIEFIVIQLSRNGDGTLSMQEQGLRRGEG